MHIILIFLEKFNALAYYVVVRGSYFNNERFVEEFSRFLRQDHRQAAFLKVYQYGMIHQNFGMIGLAAGVLNLKN